MAEVGVLNLTIKDNSGKAAGGLNKLADALTRVKTAVGNGLNLSSITQQLEKLSTAAKSCESAVKIMRQLSKITGGENLQTYASGLRSVASAIEKGANSYSTLGRLATSITKVKNATQGFKVPDMSKLESLARALSDNFNAGTGLNRLAEGMEAIKRASVGFKMPNTKGIDRVIAAMNGAGVVGENGAGNASVSASGASQDGFENVSEQVQNAVSDSMDLITTNTGLAAVEMQNQFQDSFGMIVQDAQKGSADATDAIKSAFTNQTDIFPVSSVEEGRVSFDSLREGAIQVEGTVDGVSTSVHGYLTGIVSDLHEVEQAASSAFKALPNPADTSNHGQTGIGSILREMYASTDPNGMGPFLRGEHGDRGYFSAVNDISSGTGFSRGEIFSELAKIREEAKAARKEINDMMASLEKPIDYGNLSQGLDRKFGIGADGKSAKESADAFMTDAYKQSQALIDRLNEPVKMNWGQAIDQMQGIGAQAKSAEESMSVFLQGIQGDNEVAQRIAELNPELATAAEKFDDVKEAAKYYAKEAEKAKSASSGFKETMQGLMKTLKQSTFGKLATQLGNIAKRMAMRALIRQVSSAFKEGVENVYRYSQAVGTSFAPAMDSAATSLLQMKNSIGAALAPAIQAIIPFINQLVSGIIEVINYINQMFALLNGQSTWTKALPYETKAFEDQKKSAKGAHEAMKDLLADWDELNIIQSQSGSGGSGSNGKKQEDYASMFEEVGQFDEKVKEIAEIAKTAIAFVKDHFLEILGVVKLIKWGIKMTKFSNAFTGIVGKLLSIAASAFIIKLTLDVVTTLDNKYVETGKEGWLVADVLTTALGAGIAGKLISKSFGTGFGIVTAGLTFAFSAGATFAVAGNVEDEAKRSNLNILGMAKLGLGAILGIAGLKTAGLSIAASAAGGIVLTGLAATIKYLVDMDAEQKKAASAAAKAAFAGGDDKSKKINPDKYLEALQTELNTLTKDAKLIMDIYIDVPELKSKFDDATEQLRGLSTVITGSDKLTEEDAESFKKAWKTVTDTLDDMNTKTYSTLLQGVTLALGRAVGEAKEKILELRKEFVKLNEGLDEKDAGMYMEMENIVDKLTNNNFKDDAERQALLKRYGQLSGYFTQIETQDKFEDINEMIQSGSTLDFGNSETAVENAEKYIDDVKAKIDEANKTFDDAEKALRDSYEHQMNRIKAQRENGLITEEQFKHYEAVYQSVLEESLKPIAQDREEAAKKIDEAYKLLFDTVFERSNGTQAYWKEVVSPILKKAKEAGANIPKEVMEEFGKGVVGHIIEFDAESVVSDSLKKANGSNGEIAKQINDDIKRSLQGSDSKYKDIIDVASVIGITGFDMLSDDLKKKTAIAIRKAYGPNGEEILKELGYDFSLDGKKMFDDIIGLDSYAFAKMPEDIQKTYVTSAINQYGKEAEEILKEYGYDNLLLDPIDVPAPETTAYTQALEAMCSATKSAVDYIIAELERIGANSPNNPNAAAGGGGGGKPWIAQLRATGGFVRSGDLVMANENGNFEMMGRMGNQPVVANNQQIVSGITQGVSQANNGVEGRLTTIEGLLNRILQKEFVAKAVPGSDWGGHNAKSNAAYDRVTG